MQKPQHQLKQLALAAVFSGYAVGAQAGPAGSSDATTSYGKAPIDPKGPIEIAEPLGINLPDENLWLYTKGTGVREQGSFELKLQNISRLGKNSGSYVFHDVRPELEYGLTDNWTVGVEGMIFHHDYDNVEWGPMVDTQGGPNGSFEKTQFGGFEVSTKYQIWDAFDDPIGIALGLGYEHRRAYRLDGAGIDQDTIAPGLFLQESFLNDHLQVALSGKVEFERRKSPGVLEDEIAPDVALGVSYRLRDRLWLGLETRWQSDFLSPVEDGVAEGKESSWEIDELALGDQFQWGLYVGPSLHYESNHDWWVTVGALWQVAGWSADGAAASNQGKDWDEHERMHVGIILGYEWGED